MHEPTSRTSKQKKKKSDQLLNRLIVVIVITVLFTAYQLITIDLEPQRQAESEAPPPTEDAGLEEEREAVEEEVEEATEDVQREEEDERTPIEERVSPGIVSKPSETTGGIVVEEIVDTAWEPIGTEQTGPHQSLYDGVSLDWKEKKKAIAYAVVFDESELIYWKIKDGGSPQHSIGIVSTYDEKHKYRVYLQWEDEKGWKPTKLEVLRTLDFDY